MRIAALSLVLVASSARADDHPRVTAEPEFARIIDIGPTPVILRGGQLSPKRKQRMERIARGVYNDLVGRFIVTKSDGERKPINVCMFETNEGYFDFVHEVFGEGDHSSMGFYNPSHRVVMVNLARGIGNLRHELAHPLVGDDFPGIPSWVNEGIGSLYGNVRDKNGKITFVVNYRLRHLRKARTDKTVPTLEELAASSANEVYGPRAMTYYGLARYILLYLDRRDELSGFYRTLRDEGASEEQQLVLLRKHVDFDAFLKWTDGLKMGR